MHDEMRILCTHLPYIETKMTSMTPNCNTASDLGSVPYPTHTNTQINKYMHACHDAPCVPRRACDHGAANKVNHLGADMQVVCVPRRACHDAPCVPRRACHDAPCVPRRASCHFHPIVEQLTIIFYISGLVFQPVVVFYPPSPPSRWHHEWHVPILQALRHDGTMSGTCLFSKPSVTMAP